MHGVKHKIVQSQSLSSHQLLRNPTVAKSVRKDTFPSSVRRAPSMTGKQATAQVMLFDKDKVLGDGSLEQEVRKHRLEIVQHHISPHNLVNLVYFAKNLLTSVEMARIQESKGTLCIHMRIGGDFLTMLKQMGERDPCKRDAFIRILGKLLHNLHIMKYALSQKKTDPNLKGKGGSIQKKSRDTTGHHHMPLFADEDRLLADIDTSLHGEERQFGRGQSQSTRIPTPGAGTQLDIPATDGFVNHMYHDEIPLAESNNLDYFTEPTIEAQKVDFTSCLSTRSMMLDGQPLNDMLNHNTTEILGKGKFVCKKLAQMQVSGIESNLHQPVKLCQVTNRCSPALYTFHGREFQRKVISQQEETCRSTFSLRKHGKHLDHDSSQLQPLAQEGRLFGISPAKGSQDMTSLELVAIGGDTVELPVGETIQLMPYSAVSHTSNDSTLSRFDEHDRHGIQIQDNNSEKVKEPENNCEKQHPLMEISGVSEACVDQTPVTTNFLFPITTWCNNRNECVRQDTDSGKTFFSL